MVTGSNFHEIELLFMVDPGFFGSTIIVYNGSTAHRIKADRKYLNILEFT